MSRFVASAVVVVALFGVRPVQAQDRPAPLFGEIRAAPGRSVARPRPRPPVVRTRLVRVDMSLIGGAHGTLAPASRLRLNLFLETNFVAALDRFEQTGSGYAWLGKIEGEPLSSVILVTVNGTVSGTVRIPGRTFAIRAADGVGTASEVDERLLPRGGDDAIEAPREPAPRGSGGADRGAAADDGAIIDLAVVYTRTALREAASEAELRADIDLAVALTNQTFSNSGVRTRLRQVHTGPVDYEDAGDSDTDLARLVDPSDGIMDGVHSLRDSSGADLVAFITERDDTICGKAYVNGPESRGAYGFSLTRRECLLMQNLTFAHEIGHNLGACHDWYVTGTCEDGAFTFSYGHVEPDHRVRTIMSYENLCEDQAIHDCEWIAWFSNPRIEIRGTDRALGVPAGTDTTCQEGDVNHYRCDADNVRTFDAMAPVVARYSASRSTARTFPPTLDFTCHGYVERTRGTRAYNCIPAPAQQHDMRTFVPPPGSPCDRGQVITTSDQPDRIVFQIRCRAAAGANTFSLGYVDHYGGFGTIVADTGADQRTAPPTLDFTCHGYVEVGGTRAYNCIPAPEQQHRMRTFVPPPGSPCNQGSVQEFPPGRIVFQIRCQA